MNVRHRLLVILLLGAASLGARPASAAPEANPARRAPAGASQQVVTRLIVGLAPDASRARAQSASGAATDATAAASARVASLAARTGVGMQLLRPMSADMQLVQLAGAADSTTVAQAIAELQRDSQVNFAVVDGRKFAHATTPNDPLYSGTAGTPGQTGQWYLRAPSATANGTTASATNADLAWDTSKGAAGSVIAVLDTGVRFDHPDLKKVADGGRLLDGYDFIGADPSASTFLIANDGNGRDNDPSDPGDWLTTADFSNPVFSNCGPNPEDSSWHGTRTAGMLGALTDNAVGIAGYTWAGRILPVRVLGKCGGFDSDIIDAMRWAAGLTVTGVPANPNPASVINLSLGGTGACSAAYQTAINEIHAARTVVIVASAGNEGGPVDSPANCQGVVGVTALRHIGTKVGFGNVSGSIGGVSGTVAIAAPGGNCINTTGGPCLYSLDTTVNLGTTVPAGNGYTDQTNANVGTSFSSPMVAGIVALMQSVNSQLNATQLVARLKSGARAFPTVATNPGGAAIPQCHVAASSTDLQDECNCTTATCGAGMADAAAAVAEALRPLAIASLGGSNAAGAAVTLSGANSIVANGRSVASYGWSVASFTSTASPALTAATGASSGLTIPSCGEATIRLTVTDDQGRTDTADTTVGTAAPAGGCTTAGSGGGGVTPGGGGGGGGGGALDTATLATAAAFAALALAARRRRLRAPARRTAARRAP